MGFRAPLYVTKFQGIVISQNMTLRPADDKQGPLTCVASPQVTTHLARTGSSVRLKTEHQRPSLVRRRPHVDLDFQLDQRLQHADVVDVGPLRVAAVAAVEPHHPIHGVLHELVLVAEVAHRAEGVEELVEDDAALAEPNERHPRVFRAGKPLRRRFRPETAQEGEQVLDSGRVTLVPRGAVLRDGSFINHHSSVKNIQQKMQWLGLGL